MKVEQFNYGIVIDRTMKKIRQAIQKRFKDNNIGVTVEQWAVLHKICDNNGISQNEIADGTFKDAPTVTRIIDQLCEKNLTRRHIDENDRRRFNLFPTEEGTLLMTKTLPLVIQVRKDGWQTLDENDFEHLLNTLNKVFENLTEIK